MDNPALSGLSDVSLDEDSLSLSSDDSLEDLLLSQGDPAVSRRPDETPHRPILMPLIPKKISVGEVFSPERQLPPSQSSSVLQVGLCHSLARSSGRDPPASSVVQCSGALTSLMQCSMGIFMA